MTPNLRCSQCGLICPDLFTLVEAYCGGVCRGGCGGVCSGRSGGMCMGVFSHVITLCASYINIAALKNMCLSSITHEYCITYFIVVLNINSGKKHTYYRAFLLVS